MTKIGIMSVAHMHAFSYAHALQALPNAELAAIWDDDPKRGRKAAKQFDTAFIKDLDTFLASGIEGVIICSENVKHRPMAEAAAAAGLWILCEKPLATTVRDAKAMVAACRKAKVGLGTAFPCRYAPVLQDVKRRIDAGELGTLYAATTTNNGSYPGGWFADPAFSGGGATMDHTVHVADALRWMTGREVRTVYCELGNVIHKNIGTDDVGIVHMEFDNGLKVQHVASWNRAKTFPTWGDVTLEIIGEKGVLSADAFAQKIDVYNDSANRVSWVGWGGDMDYALVGDFVQAVAERRPPAVTGEDGLAAVAITEAAHRAAKTKKPVTV